MPTGDRTFWDYNYQYSWENIEPSKYKLSGTPALPKNYPYFYLYPESGKYPNINYG